MKIEHLGCGIVATLKRGAVITASERPGGPPAVEMLTSPEADEEPIEALVERALKATDKEVVRAQTRHLITLRIASREPVAISLSSDWHIRPTGATHLRALIAYAEAVAATPNAYAICVGDVTDNPIKHKPTNVGEVWPSLRLADYVISKFNGRLLSILSGNHDDWTGTFSGVPSLEMLAKRRKIHYAPDYGIFNVEIVDPDDADHVTARYVIAARHAYRRSSGLNWTHGPKRWLEESINDWPTVGGRSELPDALYLGHHHQAAQHTENTPRGPVHYLRGGPWQLETSYSRAMSFPQCPPTAPTIILPAVQGTTTSHATFPEAMVFLRGMRDVAA